MLNRTGQNLTVLAVISALYFSHFSVFYPMPTELTAWYAADFTIALVISLALLTAQCSLLTAYCSLYISRR